MFNTRIPHILLNLSRIKYGFCQEPDIFKRRKRHQFSQKLRAEIVYLQNNFFDQSEYEQYFKEHKWDYDFNPKRSVIQFSKKVDNYQIHATALIKPHNPLNSLNKFMFKQNPTPQEGQDDCPLTQISVHLQKAGTHKWFVCQFVVYQDFAAKVTNFFANDYKGLPVTVISIGKNGYNGPEPSILDKRMQKALSKFLEDCGVNSQVLMNMARHASNCQQILIYEWLKTMNNFIKTQPISINIVEQND